MYEPGTSAVLLRSAVLDTLPSSSDESGCGVGVSDGATMLAEHCVVSGNPVAGFVITDSGSAVTLRDSSVSENLPDQDGAFGFAVQVGGGGTFLADGCDFAGNSAGGIIGLEPGTELTLRNSTVRDTLSDVSGYLGHGVEVSGGASLTVEGCVFSENREAGIQAVDMNTRVALRDVWVRDTLLDLNGDGAAGVNAGDGAAMRALDCRVSGTPWVGWKVWGGATLSMMDCELFDNARLAVSAEDTGTEMVLQRCVVRDTRAGSWDGVGNGVQAGDGAKLQVTDSVISGNTATGVYAIGYGTEARLTSCSVVDTQPIQDGRFGYGVAVEHGAALLAEGCALEGNTTVGLAAYDTGTLAVLRDTTISSTRPNFGVQGTTAMGLFAHCGALVVGEGLTARDNEGPGLYVANEGSRVTCEDCTLLENDFAGAVALAQGTLDIRSSTISGSRESVNLGGGVGVFAAEERGWDPPELIVSDSVITDNIVAGVYVAGEGSYVIRRSEIAGSTGVVHGSTARCGDGVYASGVSAWDGSSGLLLEGNTITDHAGAGLFLDDAHAMLAGNDWSGNEPDLWVEGDGCLEPREDWVEAPEQEVCPEWDRPACVLEYWLALDVVDPARLVSVFDAPRPPVPAFPQWAPRSVPALEHRAPNFRFAE